jgi:TetR/AcrR family transcriptional repressor of nem operon
MSRPKEFDPQQALEAAMQAFWEHGYEATSLQVLVERTGVQKASLYATFGDKRALFLKVLTHYQALGLARTISALEAGPSPLAALREHVRCLVQGSCSKKGPRGCLWIKSALERAPHDPEVAQLMQGHMRRVERAFREVLLRAQAAGELSANADVEAKARALYSALLGLHVYGTLLQRESSLQAAAEQLLGLLDT